MKKGKIMTNKTTLAALIGPWLLVQSYSLAQENKVVLGPRHQRDQNSEKQFNGTVPIGWEKDEEAANKLGSLLCPGTKRNKTKNGQAAITIRLSKGRSWAARFWSLEMYGAKDKPSPQHFLVVECWGRVL